MARTLAVLIGASILSLGMIPAAIAQSDTPTVLPAGITPAEILSTVEGRTIGNDFPTANQTGPDFPRQPLNYSSDGSTSLLRLNQDIQFTASPVGRDNRAGVFPPRNNEPDSGGQVQVQFGLQQ